MHASLFTLYTTFLISSSIIQFSLLSLSNGSLNLISLRQRNSLTNISRSLCVVYPLQFYIVIQIILYAYLIYLAYHMVLLHHCMFPLLFFFMGTLFLCIYEGYDITINCLLQYYFYILTSWNNFNIWWICCCSVYIVLFPYSINIVSCCMRWSSVMILDVWHKW